MKLQRGSRPLSHKGAPLTPTAKRTTCAGSTPVAGGKNIPPLFTTYKAVP
ncbi:hypothetical protein AVDCRST_MAG94-5263 [uncultured Leptolyngbya sp.]|uniref:Uncharacterized protein n=1 Tax=uncultured Leptolyngbya sp. TaxID=332963 RepID=A0A6J4NI39_9CYAN|nr:hypothetical protein AVDCRST_MAG94-5263 [uncultured Leptolyngbya sp.]